MRALATSDNKLFSGSYDGTVKVWDGPVRTLVSSGGHMFSGSYDKTVRLVALILGVWGGPGRWLDAFSWIFHALDVWNSAYTC